jgi:branched-subunit amino acid transport protein
VSTTWLILAMGAGSYALRLVGFALADRAMPRGWDRALGFAPVALLTALVVSTLRVQANEDPSRLIAVVAGGLVAYRTRQMWACIAAGMLVHWLLGPA